VTLPFPFINSLSSILAAFATLNGAFNLAAATVANQQVREAAVRATQLLEDSERHTIARVACTTCHHTGWKFRLDRVAIEHGIPIDRALAQRNLESKLGVNSGYKIALGRLDSAAQGVPVLQPAATIGAYLAGAHDLGIPPNLYLAAWARRLAGLQSPEGFWPGEDRRPPSQSPEPLSPTVYAVEGLRWYLPERETGERTAVLERARRWLLQATPKETDEKVMQLCGLRATGATKAAWQRIGRGLISEQRGDGGWAQLVTRPSDAYETGRVLVALADSALVSTTDPVYVRGLAFLLRTQFPDGSWHVASRLTTPLPLSPTPVDFHFPHGRDDVSSFNGTLWADQALMFALKRVLSPPAIYTEEEFSRVFPREPEAPWVAVALLGSSQPLTTLLEQGLDPNSTTQQGVPLLQLVVTDLDKTRLAIARGSDVNGRSPNGYTALFVAAAYRGTTDVVRLLLEHGATVNPKIPAGDPWRPYRLPMGIPLFALFQAAGTGEVEKARLLIEPGQTDLMTRALDRAVQSSDTEMVTLLAKAGADVNAVPPLVELAPLTQAVVRNDVDMTEALISLGAEVNKRDQLGYTALHHAAMMNYDDTAVIEKLLTAGGRRDAKGPDGLTPLDIAKRRGQAHLAAVLERHPQR
jgi:ankyrin repeat protein